MPEDTATATPEPEATAAPQVAGEQEPAPPWESDEQFDPEKAWRLIQNLRSDLDKAKGDRDTLKTRVEQIEDAEKTEMQRLTDRLAKMEAEKKDAERRALVLEVAQTKGVPADLVEFLVGDTRDELEAKADKLSALATVEDDRTAPPSRRPTPALRPGASPADADLNGDPLLRDLKAKLGIQ